MPPVCSSCGVELGQLHLGGCGQAALEREVNAREIARARQAQLERIERQMNPPIFVEPQSNVDIRPGTIYPSARPEESVMSEYVEMFSPPPRTSADMPSARPRQTHYVTEVMLGDPQYAAGVRIRCSCDWVVTDNYLRDMAHRDIQGMIRAHMAGGDVGPRQTPPTAAPQFRPAQPDEIVVQIASPNHTLVRRLMTSAYRCTCGRFYKMGQQNVPENDWKNHIVAELAEIEKEMMPLPKWETPEISDPSISPRRKIRLEE